MIRQIEIHNFKIHRDSTIPLAPLTMFTGINGMGKSSVTQALLLLRDNVIDGNYPKVLKIKGRSCDVGDKFANMVNWFVEDRQDKLSIILRTDNARFAFEFQYQQSDATEIPLYPGTEVYGASDLTQLSLFSDSFQYLSAYRFGPRSVYNKDTSALRHRQVSQENGYGEYAVAILEAYGNDTIAIDTMAVGEDHSLAGQAALWLNRISPNVRLAIDAAGNQCTLSYSYPARSGRMKVSPLNTGFGISYVLSVVVALLVSEPGGIVVIENPEAHIHPSAQSALMELVAMAVRGGVQVIIETHSDHIVFGSLVNMKRGILGSDDVRILHFDADPSDGRPGITPVKIGPDCRIKKAPPHFVEQMNLDLDVLFDE